MLNRKQAPDFQQIQDIHFIQPASKKLQNGIPVYLINAGDQDLVRIEFIFQRVNWDPEKPLLAAAVNGLINSGTSTRSAQDIANQIDYYGAFLQTEYTADYNVVSLYTLTKHLSAVLPILADIFNDSIFPEKELLVYKQNQKQHLEVNLQKNDYVARRVFANTLFGHTSYGVLIEAKDYDDLTREDLLSYYQAAYQALNCTVVIAGKFGESEFQTLDSVIGNSWKNNALFIQNEFEFVENSKDIYIEKPEALQSAIRIGSLSITRKHPNFPYLQILNTVLGGYFGSRLMANIREEKGYTYGIGSGVASLKEAGYFFISTEVGAEVCSLALSEIQKEVDTLRSELIGPDELALVKNYMLGSLLGSLENAFSHADKFKNLYFSGLDYDYYDNYINVVKTCTSEELLFIAQKYLVWDEMSKVVVGKK